MDLGLQQKSVIVTASSKGLGKATAKTFAEEGAYVLLSSRDQTELEEAKKEICSETGNPHVAYTVCDMTNGQAIKDMVAKAVALHGTVDVLVNNTGGPPAGGFEDFEDEAWEQAFELNLLSFVRTIREVLPYMKEQGSGHIINFTSSSIKQPIDHLILSNTFRTGIVGLAKSLSQELAPHNILINTIGPGRIATDRVAHLNEVEANQSHKSPEEVKAQSEAAIPMKRYGYPKEFANAVVYLCSGANTYMTGQSLLVDGGLVKAL